MISHKNRKTRERMKALLIIKATYKRLYCHKSLTLIMEMTQQTNFELKEIFN